MKANETEMELRAAKDEVLRIIGRNTMDTIYI